MNNEQIPTDDIYVLPVLDLYLVYAPLHHLAALVDGRAAHRIQDDLVLARNGGPSHLREIVQILRMPAGPAPQPKAGDLAPAFLGLIPTRGCNLGCEYCGFLATEGPCAVMDLELVRDLIDWYLGLVQRSGLRTAEVHFFGGEPFCAEQVIDLAVQYARLKAVQAGCTVRFEAATNGTFDSERCRWAADSLDSIVLSLDGPPDIHDRHRPHKDGTGSFETVARSARQLAEGTAELSFRACVTADTVGRMPEIAAWMCREFRPVSVSFEPLQPSAASEAAGLLPPDPWAFAQSFIQAAWILEAHGVEPVYAAADVGARRVSFCPVGQDVPIVSPDGMVTACYLLRPEWEAKGLDLRLGKFQDGSILLDEAAVAAVRGLNVWNKRACTRCFCKWHCAGGCHVNHRWAEVPGEYDGFCLQTRLITLRNILKAMGRDDLTRELWSNPSSLQTMVWRASDTLGDAEIGA